MDAALNPATLVVWGGLGLGLVFGAVANKTNFCTMGAISDVVNMGHWGRVRMWLLAVVVAMVGANLLHYTGQIDLGKTIYHRPAMPWLSLLLGGGLFGVGMTMASGCTAKNLVRLGGGSVRSLVVLVFLAVSAYMTLKGLFGQWRAGWLDPVTLDAGATGLGQVVGKLSGLPQPGALILTVLAISLGLLAFIFKDKRFRSNRVQVLGALVLGLVIVAGWYLTGHLGYGENPETLETVYFATNTRTLESLSLVAPAAFSLELLMLWTDKSLHASFGIATLVGMFLGSLAYALGTRQFRWEGFASLDDLRSHLIGAVLMGFGGVTALGCTIGQGMSGLSTLALGSLVAMFGLTSGAVAMMKYQVWRA
ncbi:YeeE/YedE family protein [Rhodoferax sp.]|uniref:YeeE/YedE family protein n=1 Tax=Rhodoferax sp. TaxID=50421 RepID=UPI00275E8BA3|nr:YeeE/YedE family protein [Rhodoferax sp.]